MSQRDSYGALRSRFDRARIAAGVSFQFRDIRAKAAADTEDLGRAQKLLGHKTRSMTNCKRSLQASRLTERLGHMLLKYLFEYQ